MRCNRTRLLDSSRHALQTQGGASILSAALEAADAAASQDGHVISAPASAAAAEPQPTAQRPAQRAQPGTGPEAGSGRRGSGGGSGSCDGSGLQRLSAAGTGGLVALATRLGPKPADSLPGAILYCIQQFDQKLPVHSIKLRIL